MATLVSDVITAAMQYIGALAQGEVPNADELTYCFNVLNDMLDRWNADRLNLISLQILTLSLNASKRNWTIGVGASDFNQARPVLIQNANSSFGGLRRQIRIVNASQYSQIIDPAGPLSSAPEVIYPDYAYPISTLYFYPVPNNSPSVELYVWLPIAAFATTSDPVAFPPAFMEAIKFELAVRIALGFGRTVQQALVLLAEGAKQDMQRLNKANWEIVTGQIGGGAGVALPPEAAPPAAQTQ